MWKAIEEQGYWAGEIWNKRKDNGLFLEWLTISAIRNDVGEVKYYAGMFSDVTQQRAEKASG
ncbi:MULTISPECIES: hypothetical protein [Bacillati]|nr:MULTISPECIES: hypothetical protein [Terrabacteria group]MED1876763.1 hypothetical protein [Brevibacillus borstelensis]